MIANHTGLNRDGVSTVQLLHHAANVELVRLFSPEHGFAGRIDIPQIDDAEDKSTGLRIFSLYGETRKPTPESLRDLDVLVFDIQDIGTRFYPYISTMGLAMEAAAEAGLPFMVLDRPNPIGGIRMDGPIRDADAASFVAFHTLPVQHGMTVGEIARMLCDERMPGLELTVIRCKRWNRSAFWDANGLV